MNEYAKEGHRFLKSIDEYFGKLGKVVGEDICAIMRNGEPLNGYNIPNPSELLVGMSAMIIPSDYRLPLAMHSCRNFDAYFEIGNDDGHINDNVLRVTVSEMGAWQLVQLMVMSMHVMPLYWHANYMKWTPVFCDKDLQQLRKSPRRYSHIKGYTYGFLPEDLPFEPTVIPVEEGHLYSVSFYVWTDFGGYLKVTSTVTFPKDTIFALVKDTKISTEIEEIVPYRASILF